jgi:hypothetical protein
MSIKRFSSTTALTPILATTSLPGLVKPDGSTITIANGVITSIGGSGGGGGGSGLNPISNTLTTGTPISPGTINPADTLTIITGGTAFTLASAADTHSHKINNQSTSNVTVTLTLNGVSQGIVVAPGSFVAVSYQSSLSTYILV